MRLASSRSSQDSFRRRRGLRRALVASWRNPAKEESEKDSYERVTQENKITKASKDGDVNANLRENLVNFVCDN